MNKVEKCQYIKLWGDVFEDKSEFIESFCNYSDENNYIFTHSENEEIVSFLHLIPTNLPTTERVLNGYYLYAVATAPQWRGKGISTVLLEKSLKQLTYDFIITVPASESLFTFYQKQGFTQQLPHIQKEILLNHLQANCGVDLHPTPLSPERLEKLRNSNLQNFRWPIDHLRYMVHQSTVQEEATIWEWKSERQTDYLWVIPRENNLILAESSVCNPDKLPIAQLISRYPKATTLTYYAPLGFDSEGTPFAAIRWNEQTRHLPEEPLAFNLALDQ